MAGSANDFTSCGRTGDRTFRDLGHGEETRSELDSVKRTRAILSTAAVACAIACSAQVEVSVQVHCVECSVQISSAAPISFGTDSKETDLFTKAPITTELSRVYKMAPGKHLWMRVQATGSNSSQEISIAALTVDPAHKLNATAIGLGDALLVVEIP